MFIIVDGVDGTGKSTVVQAMAETLEQSGKSAYHLKPYWLANKTHPPLVDLLDFDVIISAEPTNVWIGTAIREELVRNGAPYSGKSVAEAFALDRAILYTRLIIPLLAAGKTIIQDRGVSTSLCFQPLQDKTLTLTDVAELEGNQLALTYRPDHLIITEATTETILSRIGSRLDKTDDAKFEKQTFIEQAKLVFHTPEYQEYFTSRGTRIHTLNTDTPLDIMKQNARDLLQILISS